MSGFCAHTRIICPEAFAPAVTGLLFTQRFILLFYFWDSVSRPSRPALNLILTAKCVNISSASFQNCLRYVKVSTIFFNDLRFFFGTWIVHRAQYQYLIFKKLDNWIPLSDNQTILLAVANLHEYLYFFFDFGLSKGHWALSPTALRLVECSVGQRWVMLSALPDTAKWRRV